MCELIARFVTPLEIIRQFKDQHSVSLSIGTIHFYKHSPKWHGMIEKMRDKYASSVMEIPISQKRVRLERLESLYKIAAHKNNVSGAREILRAAKEEIEGAKSGDVSIVMNKVEMISDIELTDRMRKIKEEMHTIDLPREAITV